MEIIMKTFSTIFCLLGFLLVLQNPTTLQAQTSSPSIFEKKQGGIGKFKRLGFGASNSKCGQYIKQKKWKRGKNIRNGKSFFIALAKKQIAVKPSNPGFIDSRYVAFREAMIEAKGRMVKHHEAAISSQAVRNIVQNPSLFSQNKIKQQKILKDTKENNGLSGAYDKALRLLNLKLDKSLKEEGYDPKAKELSERKKAAAAANKILKSQNFSETLSAVAKNKLKGVFAKYAFENIPADASGSICVMAYYSNNTELLADAMATRDFSQAPRSKKKRGSIDSQIPSDQTDEGVKTLISSFGISIHFDEKGQVNLVSYGQAEIDNIKNDMDYEIAKGRAELIAQASIRRFVNESVSLKEKSATSQNIIEFKNKMQSVKLDKGYFKKLEEVSKAFPINGMYTLREWGAQHPLTGQGIAGAVVVWNASLAEGALADKRRLNQTLTDTGGRNKSVLQSPDRSLKGTGSSFQGGKKESEDF